MMCALRVPAFLLCGLFFVSNLPARDASIIDNLKHLINETQARITIVEEENNGIRKEIGDNELKFKKDVQDLQVTNANISEAINVHVKKYVDLYAELTGLKSEESILTESVKTLGHWIEVRKLGIVILEEDMAIFTQRRENGSAQKCQEYEKHPLLLAVSPQADETTVLTNLLQQAKTKLKEKLFANNELRAKLNASIAASELKINDLKELIAENPYPYNEEKAKSIVEKFETEAKELTGRISELKKTLTDLHKEEEGIGKVLAVLKDGFIKIQREISCYQKLERDVLEVTL